MELTTARVRRAIDKVFGTQPTQNNDGPCEIGMIFRDEETGTRVGVQFLVSPVEDGWLDIISVQDFVWDEEAYQELAVICNKWNSTRDSAKAIVSQVDGGLQLFTACDLCFPFGIDQPALEGIIDTFFQASADFWIWTVGFDLWPGGTMSFDSMADDDD